MSEPERICHNCVHGKLHQDTLHALLPREQINHQTLRIIPIFCELTAVYVQHDGTCKDCKPWVPHER